MEPITGVEEVKTLLTPRPSMASGTLQEKIADIETTLTCDQRYLGETDAPDYSQFEQATLDVGVLVETEQSQIGDYNKSRAIASD